MRLSLLCVAMIFLASTTIIAQVGIGTTDPQATFEVRAENHLGPVDEEDGIIVPRVSSLEASGRTNSQLIFLNDDWISDNGTSDLDDDILYTAGFYYWSESNTAWQPINTNVEPWNKANTTEPATDNSDNIYSLGQVGIGTANPLGALHITTENSRDVLFLRFIDNLDDDLDLDLFRSLGTVASPALLPDNTRLGGLRGQSLINPSNYTFRPSAEIYFQADGASSSSSSAGKIKFATTSRNSTSTQDRMVIRENGSVGINVNEPSAKLDVNGTLRLTDGSQGAESLLTGDVNGDAAWDKRAITKHTKLFMPGTTDYLVDIEWIEIRAIGTNGDVEIRNTHPTAQLRYSYNADNYSVSGSGSLAAGNAITITVGFAQSDINIRAVRNNAPTTANSMNFQGMIIVGNIKGFVTFDKY